MTDTFSNDNPGSEPDFVVRREPDAYGQAALLLTESLLHGLIAREVIGIEDTMEIVSVAAEVKEEIGADLGDSPATLQKSLGLLNAISASLRLDIRRA